MIPQVGGFQGCYLDNHRNNWRCARAVRALCENAPWVTHHHCGVCVPSTLNEYAGWNFRVYVRVRLLGRESSTCGWGGLGAHTWGRV